MSIDKKPCHAVEVPSIPHKRATDIDCFVEGTKRHATLGGLRTKKESRTESESLRPTYSGGRYKSSSTKCLVKKYLPTGLELKAEVWFELEGRTVP